MTLQLLNISKSYPNGSNKQILFEDLTISFCEKGFYALIGTSGTGKSTLLNIIAGIEDSDSGTIIIDGKRLDQQISRQEYRKNYISFIYQYYNLINALTIQDNIKLFMQIKGLTFDLKKVKQLFHRFELDDLLKRYPHQLSGGQKQRVAIIRAYLLQTPILLADEPTGALNESQAIEVMKALKEYANKHLVIVVSHDKDLVCKYCDQVIDLDHSKHHYLYTNQRSYHTNYFKHQRNYSLLFYVFFQMIKEKGKILMIMVSQIFTIISFLLLVTAKQGLTQAFIQSDQADPLKNSIYVFKNDYQNPNFTFDELLSFQTKDQNASYYYDLSMGIIKNQEKTMTVNFYQLPINQKNLIKVKGKEIKSNNQIYINESLDKTLNHKDTMEYIIDDKKVTLSIVGVLKNKWNQEDTIYFDVNNIDLDILDKTKSLDRIIIESKKGNIDYLLKHYNNETYYSYSEYLDQKKNYEGLLDLASLVASIFIFVSFFISMILISIILTTIFVERNKDSALLLVQGVKKKQLFFLFLVETLLINGIVSVLGCALGFFIIKGVNGLHLVQYITSFAFNLELPGQGYEVFLWLIVMYEIMGILLSFVPVKKILQLRFSEVLKEE